MLGRPPPTGQLLNLPKPPERISFGNDEALVIILNNISYNLDEYRQQNGLITGEIRNLNDDNNGIATYNFWYRLTNFFGYIFCMGSNDYDTVEINDSRRRSSTAPRSTLSTGILSPRKKTIPVENDKFQVKILDISDRKKYFENLVQESKRIFFLYTGLHRDDNFKLDWVVKTQKKGITVFVASAPNSSWQVVKSTSIVYANKNKIIKYLIDDNNISDYDENFERYEQIERIDEKSILRKLFYKAIWPAAAREIVLLSSWDQLDDEAGSMYIYGISPINDMCPPVSNKYVRATIKCSGAIVQPTKDKNGTDCCKLTLLGHSEPGGTLPSSLINMLTISVPIKTHQKLSAKLSVR